MVRADYEIWATSSATDPSPAMSAVTFATTHYVTATLSSLAEIMMGTMGLIMMRIILCHITTHSHHVITTNHEDMTIYIHICSLYSLPDLLSLSLSYEEADFNDYGHWQF